MIFNKSNLVVANIASQYEQDRGINCVHLNPDGSSVAANGNMIMAVGPVDPERVHFPDVGEQTSPGPNGISVSLDLIDKAMKNIPKGQPKLANVAMTSNSDTQKVELTTSDMKLQQRVAGFPQKDPFPNWKGVVRRFRGSFQLCVNRRDLISLLTSLEEACPDKGGENPVYMEISEEGKGMVMRCVNRETGQRAIGGITAYNTGGHWLPCDKWEQTVFDVQVKVLRIDRDTKK